MGLIKNIFGFLGRGIKKKLLAYVTVVASIVIIPTIATMVDVSNKDISKFVTYAEIEEDVVDFKSSVSLDNLCYLATEVSREGLLYDAITTYMEVRNNSAPGWTLVKDQFIISSGLAWSLWQNNYNKQVYTLVYAGTDHILQDFMDYKPMMMNEDYCDQIIDAIDVAKSINILISESNGDLDKLYIVGHSLGGYLSAFVMSEIIDSYVSPANTKSSLSIDQIKPGLSVDDVKCVTFAAPGFYEGGLAYAGEEFSITSWGKEKQYNNQKGYYDDYIINYTNIYDPVGHLFISPDHFYPLGKWYDYIITKLSSAQFSNESKKLKFFLTEMVVEQEIITNVYYHLPHVYINMLDGYAMFDDLVERHQHIHGTWEDKNIDFVNGWFCPSCKSNYRMKLGVCKICSEPCSAYCYNCKSDFKVINGVLYKEYKCDHDSWSDKESKMAEKWCSECNDDEFMDLAVCKICNEECLAYCGVCGTEYKIIDGILHKKNNEDSSGGNSEGSEVHECDYNSWSDKVNKMAEKWCSECNDDELMDLAVCKICNEECLAYCGVCGTEYKVIDGILFRKN